MKSSMTFAGREVEIARVLRPLGITPMTRSQDAMSACLPFARLHLRHSLRASEFREFRAYR
jgi:hypothetical protein